jgi:hypothetical protein
MDSILDLVSQLEVGLEPLLELECVVNTQPQFLTLETLIIIIEIM